jgi:hypothetical protein
VDLSVPFRAVGAVSMLSGGSSPCSYSRSFESLSLESDGFVFVLVQLILLRCLVGLWVGVIKNFFSGRYSFLW